LFFGVVTFKTFFDQQRSNPGFKKLLRIIRLNERRPSGRKDDYCCEPGKRREVRLALIQQTIEKTHKVQSL
jgi:hypothetical protein